MTAPIVLKTKTAVRTPSDRSCDSTLRIPGGLRGAQHRRSPMIGLQRHRAWSHSLSSPSTWKEGPPSPSPRGEDAAKPTRLSSPRSWLPATTKTMAPIPPRGHGTPPPNCAPVNNIFVRCGAALPTYPENVRLEICAGVSPMVALAPLISV